MCGTGQFERFAVRAAIAAIRGLLPNAVSIGDEVIELVIRLIVMVGINQAQVDRGVAAIGDDREQDVVTRFGRPLALFDGLDASIKHHLVAFEGRGWF